MFFLSTFFIFDIFSFDIFFDIFPFDILPFDVFVVNLLFNAEKILMDGTFSTCPKMFDQVYTIHPIEHEQCKKIQ